MNYYEAIRSLLAIDTLAERRARQLEQEVAFEQKELSNVNKVCGFNVSQQLFIIRSQLNRDMTLEMKAASWIDRIPIYVKHMDMIDHFTDQLNDATKDIDEKCSCDKLYQMINSFSTINNKSI